MLALVTVLMRALIPVGFMPVAADGTLRMMFCDGGAGASGHHVHSGSTGHGPGHRTSVDVSCPFALSAGAAPLPTLAGAAAGAPLPPVAIAAPEVPARADLPPRNSAPRGPPTLA